MHVSDPTQNIVVLSVRTEFVTSAQFLPSGNEPGYNEKEYMVGICSKCIEYKSIDENKEECKITSSSSQKPTKKKRQQTLLTFLSNKGTVKSKVNVIDSDQPKAQNTTNTTAKSEGGKARNLSKDTAESWKNGTLLNYSAEEWLEINADKKGNVITSSCKVCKMYASNIESIKNFSRAWAGDGSTNLPLNNAEGHAKGEPHKKALELHWKHIGIKNEERAEIIRNDKKQEAVTSGIAAMQAGEIEKTIKKFEIAYFLAKEELPMVKYPALLALEEKHGVELDNNYQAMCDVH